MNEENKSCSKCLKIKSTTEFYVSIYMRSECKDCTKAMTAKNRIPYKERYPTTESREPLRAYSRCWYSRNKPKMQEFRDDLKERAPDYHKELKKQRQNKRHQDVGPDASEELA